MTLLNTLFLAELDAASQAFLCKTFLHNLFADVAFRDPGSELSRLALEAIEALDAIDPVMCALDEQLALEMSRSDDV